MIELISAGIGVIGVVIGWGLNELTTTFRERPKLCFQMVSTPDDELTEKEYRVKESPSEHGIEIFNVGEKPFYFGELCDLPQEETISGLPYS